MYKKVIFDGYILGVGEVDFGGNVDEAEFNELTDLFHSAPSAPDGYTYKLRADNLEWELVELPEPEEEEPTIEDKAEAYDILMGEEESE